MVCMLWKPNNTLINKVSISKNSIPNLHWYLFHPNHVLKPKPYFFSTINSLVHMFHKLQITIHNSYFWICFCLKNKIGMTFRSFLFEGLVLILSTYESSIWCTTKLELTFRSFLFEGLVLILSTYESSIWCTTKLELN